MITAFASGIDIPPLMGENGGESEQWTCACEFEGPLSQAASAATLQVMDENGYKLAVSTADSPGDGFIVFRLRGYMDEATAEAVYALRPVIGRTVENAVQDVRLISHADYQRALASQQYPRGFSILRTVLAEIGQ